MMSPSGPHQQTTADMNDPNRNLHYKTVVIVRYFPEGSSNQEDTAVMREDVQDCIDIWEVSKFYNDC